MNPAGLYRPYALMGSDITSKVDLISPDIKTGPHHTSTSGFGQVQSGTIYEISLPVQITLQDNGHMS